MKALLMLLMLTISGTAFAVECPEGSQNPNCVGGYPGQLPDWSKRYTVECTMTDNETGAENAAFKHGNADYAQAGSMMVYLQNGIEQWYEDIRAVAEASGEIDMMLVPDPESGLTQFLEGNLAE